MTSKIIISTCLLNQSFKKCGFEVLSDFVRQTIVNRWQIMIHLWIFGIQIFTLHLGKYKFNVLFTFFSWLFCYIMIPIVTNVFRVSWPWFTPEWIVGLGMATIGLVISFVGLGDKGLKTIELDWRDSRSRLVFVYRHQDCLGLAFTITQV